MPRQDSETCPSVVTTDVVRTEGREEHGESDTAVVGARLYQTLSEGAVLKVGRAEVG